MIGNAAIEPTMRRRIEDELARIEAANGVRVVLAVESGSRAWGFPSADSDYDVRFVYIRPLSEYLSIVAQRDVIEAPIHDGLDLNGWDVRKALRHAIRSNAVLIEWLGSPVSYRDDPTVTAGLRTVVHAAAQLPALEYHYDRLARRAFADVTAADAPTIKRYFYALRATLALRWLRARRSPPPMDLASMLGGIDVPGALARTIDDLVVRKSTAHEGATIGRSAVADAFLEETLSPTVSRPLESPDPTVIERADRFLASVLLAR